MVERWQMKLAPVMLLESAERVYGDRTVENFKKQLRAENPETEIGVLDAAAYTPQRLSLLLAPTLFCEPKALVVQNLEQANRVFTEEFADYIRAPRQDVRVLVRHNGGVGGKKILETLRKQNVPHMVIAAVKNTGDKAKAVQEDVTAAKRAIASDAVAALVDALGSDLQELLSGVAQLLQDVPGKITKADVDRYFSGRIEATGFNVADALLKGNVGKAIELCRHALSTGTNAVAVVSAIDFKLRQIGQVLGMDSGNVGYRPSLPQWQITRAKQDLRRWSAPALAQALRETARADSEVKGGSHDAHYALERLILAVGRAQRLK